MTAVLWREIEVSCTTCGHTATIEVHAPDRGPWVGRLTMDHDLEGGHTLAVPTSGALWINAVSGLNIDSRSV